MLLCCNISTLSVAQKRTSNGLLIRLLSCCSFVCCIWRLAGSWLLKFYGCCVCCWLCLLINTEAGTQWNVGVWWMVAATVAMVAAVVADLSYLKLAGSGMMRRLEFSGLLLGYCYGCCVCCYGCCVCCYGCCVCCFGCWLALSVTLKLTDSGMLRRLEFGGRTETIS
jgi:hypothetical protein